MTEESNVQDVEQDVEMSSEERLAKANEVVRNYALGTAAVGVIPAPGIDLVGMTAVQLAMIHKLSSIYSVKFTKSLARNAIAALIGGGTPVLAGATVASAIRMRVDILIAQRLPRPQILLPRVAPRKSNATI